MKEHTRDLLKKSRPSPFSYDHETGVFHVGERQIKIGDFPDNTRDLALYREQELSNDELDVLLETTPVVHTFMRPVALPKLNDWLINNASDDLLEETAEVMREVFIRLRPDMSNISRGYGGFMDFDAMSTRGEPPHIFLQTLGMCACMSVSRSGFFGDRFWDDKVAGFSYHNVDAKEQKASLLAGLGHIAQRSMFN